MIPRWLHFLGIAGFFGLATGMIQAQGQPTSTNPVSRVEAASIPGAALFAPGAVLHLSLEIAPQELQQLREKPRTFVRAVVREGAERYEDVAVHLKGSVGTFRPVDEKPDWTLDFSRFREGRTFHGLRRIHLNNSLEDPSYMNEHLGSELFLKAGIPATRVGYTLLALNSRNLGLFVLKEGFTEDFLKLHFKAVGGDLYEPDSGRDADTLLKRNSVKAPFQGNGVLRPLEEVSAMTDSGQQWARLNQIMDVHRLATFMAMEIALGHRDGYCLARNNFRVYYDLDTQKLLFLPHGMDQLFGVPEAPWNPTPSGAVARALLGTPEGRSLYKESLRWVVTNVFLPADCTRRVDEWVKALQPHLEPSAFQGLSHEAQEVKDRLVRRHQFLVDQLAMPERTLFTAFGETGKLTGWSPTDLSAGVQMDQGASPDGVQSLHVRVSGETTASWRTRVLLPKGRYRFEGRVQCLRMKALPYGRHQGASLRVAGRERNDANDLKSTGWRSLTQEFSVAEAQEDVELVCEVRAVSGEVWFDQQALRISQDR